jgi:hypothetical protein
MFDVFMIKVRSCGISFLKVEFNDQTFTFYPFVILNGVKNLLRL